MRHLSILVLIFSCSFFAAAQKPVTLSGVVVNKSSAKNKLPYVNVVLKTPQDSKFISGTVTDEEGRFSFNGIDAGNYLLETSYMGYATVSQPVLVGRLSEFLDLGTIELEEQTTTLSEIVIEGEQDGVSETLDKKSFTISDNISQSGGSLLQVMQNLPGVTINQEGTLQLRGSSRVTVLIDGKQTALSGFGNQAGLDNIPSSAIERIEIINNPSAKYDANGMAGIINIIMKKEKEAGFNGKAGLSAGMGALGEKRANLPTIRPQYSYTPKINPTASFNYRKKKLNLFFQGDLLYQKRLNKNEFSDRIYSDGERINQQYQENRTQTALTTKSGFDYFFNDHNSFTLSGLYSREGHIDRGDLPYFNSGTGERTRLWQFYEDEVNSAVTASAAYLHKYQQPGHQLNLGFNYTFHREDEKYFITNTLPASIGDDRFKLIADQSVADLNLDYVKPFRHGRLETGTKLRWRHIPTDMQFFPGVNSPMDIDAAGWAIYNEIIPALYGNYIYESTQFEVETGLRVEYVNLEYQVDPNHNTYRSDGYNYMQPFPNVRIGYRINKNNTLSFFYNRRVDRPDEGDIRIFPKYDDPEILKVGNPTLRPQFTQTLELGYKTNWEEGYFYAAAYHRMTKGMITRILTAAQGSTLLYSIMQNAGAGFNSGVEITLDQEVSKIFSFNINMNAYKNVIDGFSVVNQYPFVISFQAAPQQNYSGNIKVNMFFHFLKDIDFQLTGIYLAPDIIPQGKIEERYSVDMGIKKLIQNKKGELFINMTDIFNTMTLKKEIVSDNVRLISNDLYETQIFRFGYSYKF